jgi:hypothetical protein
VRNPGYYCVATAAFSGQPFEAKMHIVDGPGRGVLPSYMKSALTYSRTLAFVAVFLVSLYGIWAVGKQERNSRPRWIFGMNALVAVSTGVAVLRWIDLELQNEDFGTLVLFPSMLVTNLLRTFQIMLVISYVSRSCQGKQDSGSWKSKASKWFWIPLGLLTSILTTRTISSAHTSVGLGLVLITAGVCAILGLQRLAKSQPGFEERNENRSRTVLQVCLFIFLIGVAGILAFNSYAVFAYGNEKQQFNSEFWIIRWFWVDGGAFGSLFLLFVPGLVLSI